MKKKKKTRLELTKRDYEIFHYLLKGKISTRDQLNKHLFGNIASQTVGRRLLRLSDENFIFRDSFLSGGSPQISYHLANKGRKAIQSELTYLVSSSSRKSDAPLHDIALNDIRQIILKRPKVLGVFSENELQICEEFKSDTDLKAFVDLNSDGAIKLKRSEGHTFFALEYDASEKSLKKYKDKIKDYYDYFSIPAVLYIGKTHRILKAVQSAEKVAVEETSQRPKFYYSLLKNVLQGNGEMIFENLSGRVFRL